MISFEGFDQNLIIQAILEWLGSFENIVPERHTNTRIVIEVCPPSLLRLGMLIIRLV